MTVIKNGQITTAHPWTHLPDGETPGTGPFTVSLARWLQDKAALAALGQPVGVRLSAADEPDALVGDLSQLPLIVIEMAAFTDGRAFTQARLLRERLGFAGEIRVIGDFLRDQMLFLARMGVDAFEFPEGTDLKDRLKAFDEFSLAYQPAADQQTPVPRLRHPQTR